MRSRFVPRRAWRVLAAAAAVLAVPVLTPDAASAGDVAGGAYKDKEEHCVTTIVGITPDGQNITEPTTCYATFPEALAAMGVPADLRADSPAELSRQALLLGPVVIFYDGFGGGGSSTSYSGACGGGSNFLAAWWNRVSSTQTSCGHVTHFDAPAQVGNSETTGNGGPHNLSALNNAAKSFDT